MAKKKKKDLMSKTKNLIGVGIMGTAGLGAMGQMATIPGMPPQAATLTPIVGTGINLAAIGSSYDIAKDMFSTNKRKCKNARKSRRQK